MYSKERLHTTSEALDVAERQEIFFATGEFLELFQDEIGEILTVLDLEWPDDPREMGNLLREKLIGRDHGSCDEKQQFSDQQAEQILPVLKAMGLFNEFDPPPGHYPVLLIPGGTTAAFEGRLPWMKQREITADQVVILAGERPADEYRDNITELFTNREDDDAWARWAASKKNDELKESHIARMMLQRMIGEVTLKAVRWSSPLAERYPQDYYFSVRQQVEDEVVEREQEVVILHGRAVNRLTGPPRPTTESTVLEWLERLAPGRSNTAAPIHIPVAGAGVYTMRMAEEVQRIVKSEGREDIVIIPAGAAPEPNSPQKLVRMGLDELGRLVCRSPSIGDS